MLGHTGCPNKNCTLLYEINGKCTVFSGTPCINGHLQLTEILTPNLIIHSFWYIWNTELTLQDKPLKLKDNLNICSYSIDRRQPSHACNVKGFPVILWPVHMMTVNMCLSFQTYTPSWYSYSMAIMPEWSGWGWLTRPGWQFNWFFVFLIHMKIVNCTKNIVPSCV